MQTLDLFNEITQKSDKPCLQYIADDGKVAKRGYISGGMHIWENLRSRGEEHMCIGPVPVGKNQVAADGLRKGAQYREFEELDVVRVTLEKIQKHWEIPRIRNYEWLSDIDWHKEVVCTPEFMISGTKLILTGNGSVPDESEVVCFILPKLLADVVTGSRLGMKWFSDARNKILLGFEGVAMGGVVHSWEITNKAAELFEPVYAGRQYQFKRTGNIIHLETEDMRVNRIPQVPTADAMAEAEKNVHVEEPSVAEELETSEAPEVQETTEPTPEKPEKKEKPKKPYEGLSTEALIGILETEIGSIKESIPRIVQVLRQLTKQSKGGASSEELKALKDENKELTNRVKSLEKEVASKKAALQALVNGKDF